MKFRGQVLKNSGGGGESMMIDIIHMNIDRNILMLMYLYVCVCIYLFVYFQE